MSNFLGKTMVSLNLIISMLAFGWAASLYFEFVDWGWKTPRREIDFAVPSEYDLRVVRKLESYRRRDSTYPAVKDAWEKVRDAEGYWVANKLWYEQELARLNSDPGTFDLNELEFVDGTLKLVTVENRLGKPVFNANPILKNAKSYESYVDDLKNFRLKARLVEKEYTEWILKQRASTQAKIGEFDGDRKTKPGLIELRQMEFDAQAQILEEIRYLEPREVQFRKDAEIYRERKDLLQQDKARALNGLR